MNYGVLLGGNADVSGQTLSTQFFADLTDWRDDPYTIGVDYHATEPEVVDSTHALEYRKEMSEGLRDFTKGKKQKKVTQLTAAILSKTQLESFGEELAA